jgi:hypothetical protein
VGYEWHVFVQKYVTDDLRPDRETFSPAILFSVGDLLQNAIDAPCASCTITRVMRIVPGSFQCNRISS